MKTSFATAISFAGVLAAGAAAFAVNTAVLDQVDSVEVAQAVTETTIDQGVADVPATVRSQDAPTVTTDPPAAATAIAQPSVTQRSTYKVGDAGRVILEVVDGRLRVASVLPSNDWTARAPEYDDGEVEVEFRSGTVEVEFKARLNNGDIQVFVESEDEANDDAYEREYHDDEDDNDHDDDDDEDDDHDEDDD